MDDRAAIADGAKIGTHKFPVEAPYECGIVPAATAMDAATDSNSRPSPNTGDTFARMRRWLPALIVGVAGILASGVAFWLVDDADRSRVTANLHVRAEWSARNVEHLVRRATVPANALAVSFGAVPWLWSAEFQRLARLARGSDPSVRALVWRPKVIGAEREAFLRSVRESEFPEFRILDVEPDGKRVEAGERNEYFPILYEALFEGQPSLQGMTLRADTSARGAAARARDEGRPIATAPFSSTILSERDPVFLLIWPVYVGGEIPASLDDRRMRLRGFINASYRVRAILAELVGSTPKIAANIRFYIGADNNSNGAERIEVASYLAATRTLGAPLGNATVPGSGSILVEHSFELHGQRWTMLFEYPEDAVGDLRSLARWGWLIAGLLLTGMASAYFSRQVVHRRTAERLVDQRTVDLAHTNERLHREAQGRESARAKLQETADTLRAIVEGSPLAVIAVGPDRTVKLWNRAAEHIFGYKAAEVVGQDYPLVPPEGEAEFRDLFQRACGGEVQRDLHVRRRRKDGKIVDIKFSGAPYYDVNGRLGGVVYSLEDVTDRLVADSILRQAQKMEAIGTLTGGLAHDFNNLLGIIIGNLDLLQDLVGSNEAARERATAAINAALRGAEVTRHLLAFSRRQPLRPRRVDANALIAGTTKLLQRSLGEQITVNFMPGEQLWTVLVDPAQLESALINLAVNARDAMPEGGVLTIQTRNTFIDETYAGSHAEVAAGHYIVIKVTDTGVGIPPEIMTRIFEPFFTTKAESKGTGLGLSMVFGFIKQSGGHVSVYSEVGQGTTFRLYLPRGNDGDLQMENQPSSGATLTAQNEVVLVVDDNAGMREMVATQLRSLGYRTLEAGNGLEALDILGRDERIDLLFTDVVMPGGMSGVQLARAARERRPSLKVLFTSGFPAESPQSGAMLAEGERLLSKPYRREDLAWEIRRIFNEG